MNCKPGDVAVIVANDITVSSGICGVHVRVTVLQRNRYGELAWEYEGPRLIERFVLRLSLELGLPVSEAIMECVPDAWLRPVPPDGVTDEEVAELYAPRQPEVA